MAQLTAAKAATRCLRHCGGLLVDDGWLRVFGSPVSGAAHGVPGLAVAGLAGVRGTR
nr:DUF2625 family protein [Streptomyces canus]